MNLTTQGKEIPSNAETFIHERKQATCQVLKDEKFVNENFTIIVKSSRRPLLILNAIAMYSIAQVIDHNEREVWHELYPSILTEQQAKRIIEKVESELNRFINEHEKGNHQG